MSERTACERALGAWFSDLPARCFVVVPGLPSGANVGVSIRGREGLAMTPLDLGCVARARRRVRAINAAAGVSALAEHAMLAGALLGWECLLADPDYLATHDARFRHLGRIGSAARVLH